MKAITARRAATVGKGRHRIAGSPGLFVLVHASGARSWVYRGWNGTKEIARGLGSLIDVSVTEARQMALKLRAGLIDGAEPARKRAGAGRPAVVHSWNDAFAHMMETREMRPSTADAYRSLWRVNVAGPLGARDVARTTRQQVIDAIMGCKGSSTGNKVRKLMQAVGKVAVSLGWADQNVANGETAAALPTAARRRTDTHHEFLPHGEIAGWLAALPNTAAADAVRLLVLTGARLSDVTGAEWTEIDGDTWTVPGARHKSGSDFRIPLSPAALATVERQRGAGRFVFPGRTAGKPISRSPLAAFQPEGCTLHGIRSAFAAWCAETGVDAELRELCLAHKLSTSAVAAVYQRSDLLDRRRAVMQKWAEYCTR